MPDSATVTQPCGMRGRSREKVSGWISRVFRLRALTPMTLAPASMARWVSTSSCTSTSAVMPSSRTRREQGRELAVGERRDDEQHEVGAVGAGLPHLVVGDHEVLAQHRHPDRGAHGIEVVEAAAEAALLGEHRHGRRSPGLVGHREGGGVGDVGQRTLARAGPLDLGDERQAGAAQHGIGVDRRARGMARACSTSDSEVRRSRQREVLTDPGDDGVQDGGHGAVAISGWTGPRRGRAGPSRSRPSTAPCPR